jgi:hypothetical protein
MLEASRRHGHYDTRFRLTVAPTRHPKLALVPDAPESTRLANELEPICRGVSRRLALASLGGLEDGLSSWEDEGGRWVEPELAVSSHELSPGLDWYAFLDGRSSRRRHDLEALKAYEAYRASSATRLVAVIL